MKDARLNGKPDVNDGTLPVMVYDWAILPETTENIWHAQMAGWPKILTYDARTVKTLEGMGSDRAPELESPSVRRSRMTRKRRENLDQVDVAFDEADPETTVRFRIPTSRTVWRDEYPFASTVENQGSTWVGNDDADEQRAQARLILQFYRTYGALTSSIAADRPFWFEVAVCNMPTMRDD